MLSLQLDINITSDSIYTSWSKIISRSLICPFIRFVYGMQRCGKLMRKKIPSGSDPLFYSLSTKKVVISLVYEDFWDTLYCNCNYRWKFYFCLTFPWSLTAHQMMRWSTGGTCMNSYTLKLNPSRWASNHFHQWKYFWKLLTLLLYK